MTAREALKHYFGYDEFRGGQEALINGILSGRDVVGIMPTGAGKSICFQVPSLMMDGVALVVSPLIALMKDQVNALTKSGLPAAYINSSLTQGQVSKALRNAVNGAYKLIYVAPERLLTSDFIAFARAVNISMLAVDEAHCISQWGHDFRPSYTQIPNFIANLSKRPIMSAFTATATPRVRADILAQLRLRNPQILVSGFDRKNLYFGARKPSNKYEALSAFLKSKEGCSGIVYCGTRKYADTLYNRLRADGYSVSRYHAGLLDKERHDNQDDFLHDRARVMIATNAFGMGIDKSNVSFVVHVNMPKDIESYYQEVGRAGRDGEPAECVLLYSDRDIRMNTWLIENDKDPKYSTNRETERRLKERNHERMREMASYGTTTECLRGFILKYFGETPPEKCGNCDRCNGVPIAAEEVDKAGKVGAKKRVVAKKKVVKGKDVDSVDNVDKVDATKKTIEAKIADKAVQTKEPVKKTVTDKADTKKESAKAIVTDKPVVKKESVKKIVTDKVDTKKNTVKQKITDKTGAKKKEDNAPESKHWSTDTVTSVKITDKSAPVSAIAGRINSYLAHLNRKEISAVAINEWLSAEGYIDTINDNGKNRKISTDKGVSVGIQTEIRKLGGVKVRVNQFDRKAQEMVVAKFCGPEAFGEGYEGLTEMAQELCKQYLDEATATPELPRVDIETLPEDFHENEREEPIIDEVIIEDQSTNESITDDLDVDEPSINEYAIDEIDITDDNVDADSARKEKIKPKPPRTIHSIIIDALKFIGRIFGLSPATDKKP